MQLQRLVYNSGISHRQLDFVLKYPFSPYMMYHTAFFHVSGNISTPKFSTKWIKEEGLNLITVCSELYKNYKMHR